MTTLLLQRLQQVPTTARTSIVKTLGLLAQKGDQDVIDAAVLLLKSSAPSQSKLSISELHHFMRAAATAMNAEASIFPSPATSAR